MDGIWYEIRFSHVETPGIKSPKEDYSKIPYFRLCGYTDMWSSNIPIHMKRQLSYKELIQHNLKND